MSFLNPFFLIGSVVLAVPVLIHLVRRERSEVIPFSSLMFLLKVPKRMIRQQMLKNLLLMALRLLLIALLVGLFARPYLVQSATPDPTGAGQGGGTVLLLDNSYSMRYADNFDKAKAEAIRRIDAMGGNDRMALIAFNDSATVLSTPTSDKSKLRGAVNVLEPSFSGTRFFEAFSLASRMLGEFGAQQKKSVVMISDFQRVGWNRSSRESVIGHDVNVETFSVAATKPNNVGIESVGVDATSFVRTYSGRVVARIHNYAKDKEVSVPVALFINDKEQSRKTVSAPANTTVLAEFTGFDLELGFAKGKVRIDVQDALALDNEFLFTIERREKLNVLILDACRPGQSVMLKTVFTAGADLPFNVRVAQAQSVTPEALNGNDVVIFNDVPRLSDGVRDRMVQLRKTGQGQLVVLANYAELGWWTKVPGFPVKSAQKIDVLKDRGKLSVLLTSYDKNHGIFKPFQTAATFTLNSAQFFKYTELELNSGATAVAKFDNGLPALAESPADDRGLLVFASSVDKTWNDLPLKPSVVPFFHQVVRYLSRYNTTRGSYTLGEGIPIVGTLDAGVARVIMPNGEQESLGELKTGEQRFFTPTEPGFHELRLGREIRVLAVDPPSKEGNLDTMVPEDLVASVKSTEAEQLKAGSLSQEDKLEYARRQMGWWYLLLIALAIGVVEIYIANKRGQRAPAVISGIVI